MSKKVTYEIDFTGRDSASGVASKIVSAVVAGQKEASSAIQRVSSALQAQGDAASTMASRNKAVLDSVANGAGGVASGIKAVTNEAASSIGRLSGQASSISELRAEMERLKRLRAEAYAAGDGEKAYNIEGQIHQLGFQINKMKSVNAEIQAQKKAAESLSSTYTQTFEEVRQALASGEADISEYTERIELQKKSIADLTSKYQQLKAAKAPSSETSSLLDQLNEEKGALAGMKDAVTSYRQSNASLESQVNAVRNEMAKLRIEGKQDTDEYASLRQEMEDLATAMKELQTEQKELSNGDGQLGGLISGVQGLMGAYSAGSGIVSMFVQDNEKLMAVQTKMQSVMAVMMGVQQVANTLHTTSAFRIVTCRKVTELWTAAQNRLTVAFRLSATASKAMLATMTLGASLIVTGVITAISKLVQKYKEKSEAQKEAKKVEEETMKSVQDSVAGSVAAQLVSYRKLQKTWNDLSGNIAKQKKFVKDNAEEFRKLGVQVKSVKDAENVLVSGESTFVESLKRRAMAAAAMELASKKYQTAIENMLKAENAKQVTDDDRKNARTYAEGVYQNKVASAKGAIGRGQVSTQKGQIVSGAYNSKVGTYGEARAKEYDDAAKKEMSEGDRYFSIVKKYNDEADKLLKSGGMTPSGDSGSLGGKAGSIDAIEKKIQSLTSQMKSAGASERAELQKDINAWQKKLDAVNLEMEALSVPSDPKTIKELDTAIAYYGKLLKIAGDEERAEIQKTINGYTKKKTVIEDSLKAVSVPASPKTFEEYSTVISALEERLKKASASEQADIQATINAYRREEDELKARVALASSPVVLNSLADYDQAISACESALQYANDEERANIQRTINDYKKKREAIEESLASLDVPSDPKSLEDIDKVISALETKIQKAGASERGEIQRQIDQWKAKKDAIEESLQLVGMDDLSAMVQNGLGVGGDLEISLRTRLVGAEIAKSKIEELQKMSAVAQTPAERKSIQKAIGQWRQYSAGLGETQTQGEKTTGMLQNMSSIAGSLSGVVGDNAAGWLSWGANVLSAVAAALPAIASLIGGNIAQAFAGAAAQSQSVPFPYNLISLAASMAAVGAAVASIPAYADGGIAFGPTVGLFGEYPGAQHNPEVVAPLDKLKSLIGVEDVGGKRKVEFRIKGKDLVGVEQYENNRRRRS